MEGGVQLEAERAPGVPKRRRFTCPGIWQYVNGDALT